jgi:hypothetical protein
MQRTEGLPRSRCLSSLLLVIPAAMLLAVGVASAGAATSIEGVWSFNGGTVDIQGQADGAFRGVVVAPTRFAQCSHPVNENMWTDIHLQPDGSYWGLHQWYFESCLPNRILGPTAWRIVGAPAGPRFLRVCFSAPGSSAQPTIAPDGSHANVTFGCRDSALIAPLPVATSNQVSNSSKSVVLPTKAQACVNNRSLEIKLYDPKYDPFKELIVWINGKKAADMSNIKKLKKGIRLKGLPNGTYTIKVLAITVLNHRLSRSCNYGTCTKTSGINEPHRVKPRPPQHHKKPSTHNRKKGGRIRKGQPVRVFPISDLTDLDVWRYIAEEHF